MPIKRKSSNIALVALDYIYMYSFSSRFYLKWLTDEQYNKRIILNT